MRRIQILKRAGASAITAALLIAAAVVSSRMAHAGDDRQSTEAKIRIGFAIAPVPLNLSGKNVELVGLGSYIVNAQTSCNDCHSAGPQTQYAPGGNPFFGQKPAKQNPATYLGGGRSFGSLVPNTPEIVSRNLTPDKTGKTLGGDSFTDFVKTMRTGTDPDHVHPTCSSTSAGPCLPPPFDGELLQIMPWPNFRSMTDHELLAIYEYLGAIPCVEGGPGQPSSRCR